MKKSYLTRFIKSCIFILAFSSGVMNVYGSSPALRQADTLRKASAGKSFRYMASMSLGLLPGSHDVISYVPVSIQISHGMLHNSGVYTGITFGVETFAPDILPVVFDLRYYLPKVNITPWFGFISGYGFTLSDNYYSSNYTGGMAFGASAGMSYMISKQVSWWFSVGYRYQYLRGTSTDYYEYTRINILTYNRLELRIGVAFH